MSAPALGGDSDIDEPHRLFRRAAIGSGDAGDRDGDVRGSALQRAFGHGAAHLFAHGAVARDEIGRHAEQLGLGGVGIGDEAAFDHGGRAGTSVNSPASRPPVQLSAVAISSAAPLQLRRAATCASS